MSILALLFATALSQPALPLLESGSFNDSGYSAYLTIAPDGHWTATGEQSGTLTPEQLAQIRAGTETVRLTTFQNPECKTIPIRMVLRVPRGEVRYSALCGPQADASVGRLLRLARAYTTMISNPTVARLDRWRTGDEERKSSVFLMADGVWTTDESAGNTGGQELGDAIAAFRDADLSVWPPSPQANCRSDYWHELSVPGRGQLRWIAYCQTPSPSLAAALARMQAIVRL